MSPYESKWGSQPAPPRSGGREAVCSSGKGGNVVVHVSKEKIHAVEKNNSIEGAMGIGRSLSLLRT